MTVILEKAFSCCKRVLVSDYFECLNGNYIELTIFHFIILRLHLQLHAQYDGASNKKSI